MPHGSCARRPRRRDSETLGCEPWCRMAHCGRWCKCSACSRCQPILQPRCLHKNSSIHGEWSRRPSRGGFINKETCIDKHRGSPGWFEPEGCQIGRQRPQQLRGHILMLGDSLMAFQFAALVAWLRRAGMPLRCTDAAALILPSAPSVPSSSSGRSSGRSSGSSSDDGGSAIGRGTAAALRDLMNVDRYDSRPTDCVRAGLRLSVRRLNLLPTSEAEAEALLSPLLRSMGADGVVLVNAGLWHGPLSRHEALQSRRAASRGRRRQQARGAAATALSGDDDDDGTPTAVSEALQLVHAGAMALLRVACRRQDWPQLLWRETLPQHFASGGVFRANASRQACRPLADDAAARIYQRTVAPTTEAWRRAAGDERCRTAVGVLPTFWPLVARHRDHEGFHMRAVASQRTARADCTHYLPCSGAMMLLNRLLLDAVLGSSDGSGKTRRRPG